MPFVFERKEKFCTNMRKLMFRWSSWWKLRYHIWHRRLRSMCCIYWFSFYSALVIFMFHLLSCLIAWSGELFRFSFPGHLLLLSRGETENGPRRLTSAGRGRTDRRQQLEGQTIEWKRVVKDGERKWSRSRAQAEYEPWSASKSRSCRGDETLSVYVCADTKRTD